MYSLKVLFPQTNLLSKKNVHLTNTHLSKEIFDQATEDNLYQGMNEQELRDYQMWLMEDLQNYLLKIVNSTNFTSSHLRLVGKNS